MRIPEKYNVIMPYLIVKESSNFRKFMTDVFDAKEQQLTATENGDEIRHGELNINGSVIMFSEATEEFKIMNAGMYIYVPDLQLAYNNALQSGATTIPGQEPRKQENGYTCGIVDPFGNTWWITEAEK